MDPDSSKSRTARAAILLEEYLKRSFYVGLGGALFIGGWLIVYIVMGTTAEMLGWIDPPYPFLSLQSDPPFVVGSAITGLLIVQSVGSLVLYYFLVGIENDRSQFAMLMGFISLGFGGALLRVTLPASLQILLEFL